MQLLFDMLDHHSSDIVTARAQLNSFLCQFVGGSRGDGFRAAIESMERFFMAPTTSVEERAALRHWIVNIDPRLSMDVAVPAAPGSGGVASAMSSLTGPSNVAAAVAETGAAARLSMEVAVPAAPGSGGVASAMSSLTGPSNVAAAAAVAETGAAAAAVTGDAGPPNAAKKNAIMQRVLRLIPLIGSCRKKQGNEAQLGVAAGASTEGGNREDGAGPAAGATAGAAAATAEASTMTAGGNREDGAGAAVGAPAAAAAGASTEGGNREDGASAAAGATAAAAGVAAAPDDAPVTPDAAAAVADAAPDAAASRFGAWENASESSPLD
jgi:hypothetical protein